MRKYEENMKMKEYMKKTKPTKVKKLRITEEIPVQVPAIETCFRPIDEIARIFFESQSPYI